MKGIGIKRIFLEVSVDNIQAINFYLKNGGTEENKHTIM
jgi:ribosomal protein S18 acetylase RimI-like enzyme